MNLNSIIFPTVIVVICVALHELGHFTMAKYFKRSAWFRVGKVKGIPAIITSHKREFEIHTYVDLKRAFKEEIKITQAGLLSVVLPLFLICLYPAFWQFFFIVILLFMIYTIWEIEFIINIEVEKIEKYSLF